VRARDRLVGVVLRDELAGDRIEGLAVGFRPPVAQAALAVELAALVVEAMADLVADHRADRPVVDRVVRLHVEERRLQDRSRENDLVLGRVVVGVDGLRRHAPLLVIAGLAEIRELILPFEAA